MIRRNAPAFGSMLIVLALAACGLPPTGTATAAPGDAAPVVPAASVTAKAAGTKPKAQGLGEDKGWVLVSFSPKLSVGTLTAQARVKNVSGSETAVFQVSYVDASENVTHSFMGSADGIAHGKTVTVTFLATEGTTVPRTKPQFQVTMG